MADPEPTVTIDHQQLTRADWSPGEMADYVAASPVSPFASSKDAARALLMHPEPKLTMRSGQFCGGLMFSDEPLTEKQDRWIRDLLRKHGLPPLADGGEA